MKNIAVLMGGKSYEHEISLLSGEQVVKHLDSKKYNVFPIVITKSGEGWDKLITNKRNIDLVFLAMHGTNGEDGTVQGMLDTLDIPYTGSKVLASALAMDKLLFRRLLAQEEIKIPKFVSVSKDQTLDEVLPKNFSLPYFIKPHNQGSSVGTSVVNSKRDLITGLKLAWKYSSIALVDEYIDGIEITCPVLGNESPFALPLVEIRPKGEYFDFDSKYRKDGATEVVPAGISDQLTKEIQSIAVKVYKLLGCRGFGRVDFLVHAKKEIYVLELNTIPGLTETSLLPKSASAAGLSFSQLLDKVINYAQ